MDQNLNNRHKDVFYSLLANPVNPEQSYSDELAQMVNDHPQSGILQVLYALSGNEQEAAKASVYFNAGTLYKLLYEPNSLPADNLNHIVSPPGASLLHENYFSIPHEDDVNLLHHPGGQDIINVTEKLDAAPEVLNEAPEDLVKINVNEQVGPENKEAEFSYDNTNQEPEKTVPPGDPDDAADVSNKRKSGEDNPDHDTENKNHVQEPESDEESTVISNKPAMTAFADHDTLMLRADTVIIDSRNDNAGPPQEVVLRQEIEDEIYEEIVGIEDIGFELIKRPVENNLNEISEEGSANKTGISHEEEGSASVQNLTKNDAIPVNADTLVNEEKLILENIVGADYLAFDKKLDELRNADNDQAETLITDGGQPKESEIVYAGNDVSRYNDDKMPYSFMWWLDKTRKEHAANLQPYSVITKANDTARPGDDQQLYKPGIVNELQHQYYENIFNVTTIETTIGSGGKPVEFDHGKKEDVIIERFIHNEPQIRPPAADKLDTENKAKKSAEDQDILVTETLAQIYTDQMLYHKALATYRKLLLKFPEKNLYFAARIAELEKRTN